MPSPLRSRVWRLAMLGTLQLWPAAVPPGLPPAAAQVPSQSLMPSTALRRPPATVVAPAYLVRTATQTTQADGPAKDPARVLAQPLEPPPVPDRGQQIMQMQLAHRTVAAPRRLAPTEATAMWRGYTARIGKAPALGGAGGAGSTSGGGGTAATGSQ